MRVTCDAINATAMAEGTRRTRRRRRGVPGGGARVFHVPQPGRLLYAPVFFFIKRAWLSVVFVASSVVAASVGRFVVLAIFCLEGQRFRHI